MGGQAGEEGGLPGLTVQKELRIGVAGVGFIGVVHAQAARRAGARIAGVAASTRDSAEAAAIRIGADEAFADAEALAVSPDIDVLHICSPNHLHRPLAEAALAAGKHVVCEKPLALDGAEARSLREAADAAGVVATVPFVYRFYPMAREARARVVNDLAPVRLIHGTYLQDWMSTADDDNWRVDASFAGESRAFADIGSHWCDLVEFVTGDRLVAVCAELVTAIPERLARGPHAHAFEVAPAGDGQRRAVTTEDIAMMLFRTAGGVTGSLVVSQVSPGRKNCLRFEIATADATVGFDQERPDTLWLGRRGVSEVVDRDPAQLDASAAAYVTTPPGHPQGYQDCFDAFVADTYRAIAAGGVAEIDGLPSFADGARAAAITDAVLRSAAHHGWEDISGEESSP